jgi:hypothetical protein
MDREPSTLEPGVTIVIPTYNRARYLEASLASAMNQQGADVRIVVLDNASTDDTREVVQRLRDRRVSYVRSEVNSGMLGNFLRIRQFCSTEYLCVLQDDDRLLPGFATATASALRQNRSAAMAFSRVRIVSADDVTLDEDDARCRAATGLIDGRHHLEKIIEGENRVIHLSSALLRVAGLDRCGWFDAPHGHYTLDFNLHFRLAARFDLYAVPQVLTCVRHHSEQDHRGLGPATGAIAMLAERIDAVGLLLEADTPNPERCRWLSSRLREFNQRRSTLMTDAIGGIESSWQGRLQLLRIEIDTLLTETGSTVFADDNQLPQEELGRRTLPFIERNGEYWGAPADSASAIAELERQRASGTRYFVVAWTAFWLLDYYTAFREHLVSRYDCLASNSRLVIFDLGTHPANRRPAARSRSSGVPTSRQRPCGNSTASTRKPCSTAACSTRPK